MPAKRLLVSLDEEFLMKLQLAKVNNKSSSNIAKNLIIAMFRTSRGKNVC
ncbi:MULTISPECIES: hypothetical protein [unclassified Candidatus Tisiphia]